MGKLVTFLRSFHFSYIVIIDLIFLWTLAPPTKISRDFPDSTVLIVPIFQPQHNTASNASLPRLELGDTLLLGVCDEHQVNSIEKLPRHTSDELARQCFQQQDGEKWAKDRALMHTNSYAKLLTVLTIDPHTALGIVVHAQDDTHNPFIHTQAPQGPPQDLSWHTLSKAFSRSTKAK